jgi:hypothetical protein
VNGLTTVRIRGVTVTSPNGSNAADKKLTTVKSVAFMHLAILRIDSQLRLGLQPLRALKGRKCNLTKTFLAQHEIQLGAEVFDRQTPLGIWRRQQSRVPAPGYGYIPDLAKEQLQRHVKAGVLGLSMPKVIESPQVIET